MKKVVAAVALTVIAAAIIKKVRSSKKEEASEYTRHLHTGPREEAYFKLRKKSGGKRPQYA